MTSKETQGKKIIDSLFEKAWRDPTFKHQLISYPEKTIERFFNKRLPENLKIKVTDQSDPTYLYINIPLKLL